MSNVQPFLEEIVNLLEGLRVGTINGRLFVRRFDDLMADAIPSSLDRSSVVYHLLDEYHTEFALFVENPRWRAEFPQHYYGAEDLQVKALVLLDKLKPFIRKEGTKE